MIGTFPLSLDFVYPERSEAESNGLGMTKGELPSNKLLR
jgi:hypothetical protein